MKQRISKITLLLLVLALLFALPVFAGEEEALALADTKDYTLSADFVTEVYELDTDNRRGTDLPVYVLPVGAGFSLTAHSDLVQSVRCYDKENQVVKAFSMSPDGRQGKKAAPMDSGSQVHYTVTALDTAYAFMEIALTVGNKEISYCFFVDKKIDITPTVEKPLPTRTTAKPAEVSVFVDGKEQAMPAYYIDQNNYFKLRDLAHILYGTEKQFDVEWHQEARAILITTQRSYVATGGELTPASDNTPRKVTSHTATIYVDGVPCDLTAYNIGGNNYFKLRDIGELADFQVNWDPETGAIGILL